MHMLDTLKIIFSLSLPVMLGYIICKALLNNRSPFGLLYMLALSYGMGFGVLSVAMFLLSLCRIKFSVTNITLSLAIIAVIFLPVYLRTSRGRKKSDNPPKNIPLIHKILIAVILLAFLTILLQALLVPLEAWDSWAIYGFKAKAFYLERMVSANFLKDATKSYSHPDYPLLVPLIEAWFYACLGSWNDQLVKIIFPLFFISLTILLYYNLRYYISRKYALLFTALFVTIPHCIFLGSSGYADLPLTFYYFTGFVFMLRACNDFDKRLLFISACFCAFAAWTKNEGIVISIFNFFMLLFVMILQKKIGLRNILLAMQYLLIIVLINAPWFWFKSSLGLVNDVVNRTNLSESIIINNLSRVQAVIAWAVKQMFLVNSWNLLWVFSSVIMILNFRKLFKLPSLPVFLSLLLYCGAWGFIFILSPYDINWHLATSFNRLMLQITPLVLFLDCLLIYQEI